jgi:DnaJ-class molecular chaperone
MAMEACRVCGGDGRIGNAFGGSATTCPACRGNGRRSDGEGLMRDVTKTKPSHHRGPDKAPVVAKPTWPTTGEGAALAREVQASAILSEETKARLVREILEYEATHGKCTQTFSRKVRRQLRPTP